MTRLQDQTKPKCNLEESVTLYILTLHPVRAKSGGTACYEFNCFETCVWLMLDSRFTCLVFQASNSRRLSTICVRGAKVWVSGCSIRPLPERHSRNSAVFLIST